MDTVIRSWEIIAYMTWRGGLLGSSLGALFGTVLAPILGTLCGLIYGGIVGVALGFADGLLIALLTWLLDRLDWRQNYSQIITLCTTLLTLIGGIVGFSTVTGQSVFVPGARQYPTLSPTFMFYIGVPTLIAVLSAGWVSQGLARAFENCTEKRKHKPKRGEIPEYEVR